MSGKLVEQNSGDESAIELVHRIERRKKELVETGEVKRFRTYEPVRPNEIPFSLPCGWQALRLGALVSKLGAGSTPSGGKTVYETSGVPFLRSQNVHDDGLRLQDVAYIPRHIHARMSGTHVRPDDVLLNITGGSIGRTSLVPDWFAEGNVSQHVAIIRLIDPSIRGFLHVQLRSSLVQKAIQKVQVGASREGLSMQRLSQFPILLPPEAEQERIMEKVAELVELCDTLEDRQAEEEHRRSRFTVSSLHSLQRAAESAAPDIQRSSGLYLHNLPRVLAEPGQVALLRQALLDVAVQGRLVEQEPDDEPSSSLLERIAREKAELIEQKRIRRPATRRSGGQGLAVPWVLPRGWSVCALESVCLSITDGDHLPPPKADSGIPFLVISDVRGREINLQTSRFVASSYFNSLDWTRKPRPGDILYTLVGSYGIPVAVKDDKPFCVQRHIGILRPSQQVDVGFLVHALGSRWVYDQATSVATGIAQKTVGLAGLRRIVLPLPPLQEQVRIRQKLDELFGICDELEESLVAVADGRERLLRASLRTALPVAE
ncbi:restriction endonuclease subunit S [Micromonospora sp. KC606]|uniref:restriction endonuclease subunit S n=1 Tax=Micromonospora sp. KC606 TaxID=2530379 RepID=UPI00140485DA|nr:restriction endonuclease subunit S [Micromonospora sp. KC606]